MNIVIRPLATGDKPVWLKLFKDYIEFYRTSVPDDVIELTWHRLHSGAEGCHRGLVATRPEDDLPVGLAHILMHRTTWSATWACYLEDLYVQPECRALGIGRQLISAVYDEADRFGCTRTYWVTEEQNARARQLYDQMATKAPFVQYRR